MGQAFWRVCIVAVVVAIAAGVGRAKADEGDAAPPTSPPASLEEARARARILHEAFHGALQVMHRDFFDDEQARVLPSGSLKDVFSELERIYGIELRWLAVNAKAMNIDHQPRDQFELAAVKALSSGKSEFEQLQSGQYRHAGTIRLASQCLKCHLPDRKSTDDRAAALTIGMRVVPALDGQRD
jgi:hypothetical protein